MEELTRLPKLPSIGSIRNLPPGAKREFRQGMFFLSPWILGFLAFTLIPMIATLLFTFVDLRITEGILNPTTFVGLENYSTMVGDPQTWKSMWITIRFGLIALCRRGFSMGGDAQPRNRLD
jgi:ABC-type sugar transport system permease subunit